MKQIGAVPFDRTLSNAEQKVVREWLETHSPALVELYDSFNRLLDDESIPGRARLIGHCIREIRSNLLEQIVAKKGPSLQYPVELKAIAEKARQEGGGLAPNVASFRLVIPPLNVVDDMKAINALLEGGLSEEAIEDLRSVVPRVV